jgi:DNA-binding MurR/RpiR family transcriptional regulator
MLAVDMTRTKPHLDERIRAIYGELPSREKALADVLLEFPGDIAIYAASDLARRAETSNAAVTRFMKRLGYKDYKEAQYEVRAAQASGQPIYLNNSLVQPPSQSVSIQKHLEQEMLNLQRTLDAVDPAVATQVVKKILQAKRVWTLGFRNSYFFAAYLRRQLNIIRPDVTLLPVPGQLISEDLGTATPKDVVIIVGMRRRVAILPKIMRALHARGVPIIYITDHRAVSTAKLATWTFRCHARGVSLFDSYVSVMSILNFLCTEVMAQAGGKGRQRLQSGESMIDDAQEIELSN